MVAISSVECTFSVYNMYWVHNAKTHDYFILTFVTLWYLYLVLCRHADMISDLLFSMVDLSARAITSYSVRHKSHLLVPHLYLWACHIDTPINFDVLLINTFITQLPEVFGKLGRIYLAWVFERQFVISIATFELWLRATIVVFLGTIWGTDRCFVNNTLYSHAVSFQRAVFRFITVAGTRWGDSLFLSFQDLMVMATDDWSHLWHTTIWHFDSISIEKPVKWMSNMEM